MSARDRTFPPSVEEAIDTLAKQMYERFERIAPGLSAYFVPWDELPEVGRQTYRSVVEDLSRFVAEWELLERSSRPCSGQSGR